MPLTEEQLYQVQGPILILGETGTGKGYMAKKIHQQVRKDRSYVVCNLSTMAEGVIESELFGHTRGSFTNAYEDKYGYLHQAQNGTLFLDEIGELSPSVQRKLLNLLDDGLYYRVGDNNPHYFKGHIIAATHRNLAKMVKAGTFRQDLFYRLRVYMHELPPLRHSLKKRQQIIQQFQDELMLRKGKKFQISPEAEALIHTHSWPGNIRELRHCLDYLAQTSRPHEVILPSHFPDWFWHEDQENQNDESHNSPSPSSTLTLDPFQDYPSALAQFEQQYLAHALKHHQGRINETSVKINLSKSTLIAKARKYGINTALLRAESHQLSILRGERQ